MLRSFDWLRLAPPGTYAAERRDFQVVLTVPGEYRAPGAGWVVSLETTGAESGYNKRESALDWGRISCELVLRYWRPGDQYRPVGHTNRKKIKILFQECRIPLWRRRQWPVITCGEDIVWAARFGAAAEYAATAEARNVLKIRESGSVSDFCD